MIVWKLIYGMLINFDNIMINNDDLMTLKKIALMGGLKSQVCLSSQAMGEQLDISPQTASRRLISLEKGKYISRTIRPDGQYVRINESGERVLKGEYFDYCRIFEEKDVSYSLRGEVISGLGEGRYYVSIPRYMEQFRDKLGFEPFPGTLNLRLDTVSLETRRELEKLEWIEIEGFVDNDRTFGSAKCLPCRIRGSASAIIVPGRTHYPDDIIELLCEHGLRTKLGLKDGDKVKVEISND